MMPPVQFMPEYMWGGLTPFKGALETLAQAMSVQGRQARAAKGAPSNWWENAPGRWSQGTSLLTRLLNPVYTNPENVGEYYFGRNAPDEYQRYRPMFDQLPWDMDKLIELEEKRKKDAAAAAAEKPQEMAEGGVVKPLSGPIQQLLDLIGMEKGTQDTVPVMEKAGEVVLRSEAVEALGGPGRVDSINSLFDLPQMNEGGPFPRLARRQEEPKEAFPNLTLAGPGERYPASRELQGQVGASDEEKAALLQLLQHLLYTGNEGLYQEPGIPGLSAPSQRNVPPPRQFPGGLTPESIVAQLAGGSRPQPPEPQAPTDFESFKAMYLQQAPNATDDEILTAFSQSNRNSLVLPSNTIPGPGTVGGERFPFERSRLTSGVEGGTPTPPGPLSPELQVTPQTPLPKEDGIIPPPKPETLAAGNPQPSEANLTPSLQMPGMRAPGSPMPIDWEAIKKMDPFSAMQYLQQMAQTQGQLPGILRPQSNIPPSQELFQDLVDTYRAGQEGVTAQQEQQLNIPKLIQAGLLDEAYYKDLLSDQDLLRDQEYKLLVEKTAAANANANYLRLQANTTGVFDPEQWNAYIGSLSNLVDLSLDVIRAGKDNEMTWKKYLESSIKYALATDPGMRGKTAEEIATHSSVVGRLSGSKWRRTEELLTEEEITTIMNDINNSMDALIGTGGGKSAVQIYMEAGGG